MAEHAEVFISATTTDLGSYRGEVKNGIFWPQVHSHPLLTDRPLAGTLFTPCQTSSIRQVLSVKIGTLYSS
jgi:hypothetical protein